MVKSKVSNYKWYILTLSALTHTLVMGMPMMSMPVLFKEISEDLGLSLVQIGTVWGMGAAGGIFVVLFAGLLGDRFGVKRFLSVACLLVGLSGAMRGLAGDFITLVATVFLNGLISATVTINVHKTAAVWFPRQQLALANGILSTGMAVGFMAGAMISATVLSPLLGGWRNVIFLFGAISVVIGILWMLSRSQPAQVESSTGHASMIPLRQALSHVVRIRMVWVLGLTMLFYSACTQGLRGYLALYLRDMGWTGAGADGTLAAFSVASLICVIPLALLSDRLGSRKAILFGGMLTATIGVGLLSVASGPMVWVAVIIAGIFFDGFMAVLFTLVMEIEGIGPTYAGTAIGIVLTTSMLGSIISPPLGNSFASIDPGAPFIFWAALAAIGLLSFFFIKETGRRRLQEI